MIPTTTEATEKTPKIIAAAVAEAGRLCKQALAACVELKATPAQLARAKRYQIEEFRQCGHNCKRNERPVFELFTNDEWESREELLAAINVYCDAGIAEVERLFSVAHPSFASHVAQ